MRKDLNPNKVKSSAKNNSENGSNISLGIEKAQALSYYRAMLLARKIDTKTMNLLKQGRTYFHIAGAGHEAIQVAMASQFDPLVDWLFPYYRDLAFTLSVGMSTEEFFLQCFAKANDPASGGRQLPCHWGSSRLNIPAQSSPTGTQFLQAVGTALASVKKGIKNVTYVSSGEGTTSQGEFYEALNWASREKLPVIFVIQNNGYAISVPVWQQNAADSGSISDLFHSYQNLKIIKVDGTNLIESIAAAKEAKEYSISGNGPVLIEAKVVRLQSHSSSDDQKKYRDSEELTEELNRCPIKMFEKYLLDNNLADENTLRQIDEELSKEIDEASSKALKSPEPDPATALQYVYDESLNSELLEYEKNVPSGKSIVMVDAINHCLAEELDANKDIYIFGEDIEDDKGGVFTATKGLSTKFGRERVFNSPLAEASIVGVATGMALAGLKPVVEIQFGDYIWPAFMQYRDEVSSFRYRSNNRWPVPFVTRVAVGGTIHGGLYHSQNIEAFFAHIPGILIAYPSNANDAKGLLKTAMRLNDPVLFLEHKGLYRQGYAMGAEPDSEYLIPFGRAKVVKEGADVTVISYGLSLWDSMFAARKLEEEGLSVEVIDLRTIVPLDEETIYNSVKKTNKAIVIHEDTLTLGFGAEISARIAENCFQYLDAPVRRVAAKDGHIPYSPTLENDILPSRDLIYKKIKELILY